MNRRWIGIVAAALLLVWRVQAASADAGGSRADSLGAPEGYEPLVDRAIQEASLQNYVEARSLLLEAHRVFPNARTLRALGKVEYELRNYITARDYLRQAVASSIRPLDARMRAEAEQLQAQAESYIAKYFLKVTPAEASIELDDAVVTPDREGAILVTVGDHTLQVSAAGHRTVRRALHATGAGRQDLLIMLSPERSDGKPDTALIAPSTPVYRKWWLWTTVGLVLAGGAAATAFVLIKADTQPGGAYGGTSMSVLRGPER